MAAATFVLAITATAPGGESTPSGDTGAHRLTTPAAAGAVSSGTAVSAKEPGVRVEVAGIWASAVPDSSSGAAVGETAVSGSAVPASSDPERAAPDSCPATRALRFYRAREASWLTKMGAGNAAVKTDGYRKSAPCPRSALDRIGSKCKSAWPVIPGKFMLEGDAIAVIRTGDEQELSGLRRGLSPREGQSATTGKVIPQRVIQRVTVLFAGTDSEIVSDAVVQEKFGIIEMRIPAITNRRTLRSSAVAAISSITWANRRVRAHIAGSCLRSSSAGAATSVTSTSVSTDSIAHLRSSRALRRAMGFYTNAIHMWERKMGRLLSQFRTNAATPYNVKIRRAKARAARRAWERFRTLRDFPIRPDANAWLRAVEEAQRPYPGSRAWLRSCSAAEGGWGRWVRYGGGPYYVGLENHDVSGGWLQFKFGTFKGFYRRAIDDVRQHGFKVERLDPVAGWLSPLGQALAGAWGYVNGLRGHWAGSGC